MERLSPRVSVLAVLRGRDELDVQSTVRVVLERLKREKAFTSLDKYIYSTLHHFHPRDEQFNWSKSPEDLLKDLRAEPRAAISLEGPSLSVRININCRDVIVSELVDGKTRNVPEPSNISQLGISVAANRFIEPYFPQEYIQLIGDLFEVIKGEYGWAQHMAIKHGNDFDRVHSNLLEPWFVIWVNLFGPVLVEQFGLKRLLSAPAYAVHEFPGGSLVLIVCANPLDQRVPEIERTIIRVKEHLGVLSPSERATPEELEAFEKRNLAAQAEMNQRIAQAFRKAREGIADEMLRQSEGCVQGVQKYWGEDLDFSPASLRIVDKLIESGFDKDEDEETIEAAVQAFGPYVGEVIRRHYGGVWHDEEMQGQPFLINVGNSKSQVDPFRAADKRFQERGQFHGFQLSYWFEEIGLRET